jgi:hypothetical protein
MRHWVFILLFLPWFVVQSRSAIAEIHSTLAKAGDPWFFTEQTGAGIDPALLTLTDLTEAATLIVRGQVSHVRSFWSPDHSMIESETTLAVDYFLRGASERILLVRTAGGYLAEEGLGMVSTHEATFAVGEEVLLFLQQGAAGWQMVEGAAGKYLISGAIVTNEDLLLTQPLGELLLTVDELLAELKVESQLPQNWLQLEMQRPSAALPAVMGATGAHKWATPHAAAAFYVNINTDQVGDEDGDQADFRNAIIAAAASWSGVEGVDFTLTYAGPTSATQAGYNGVNEVLFMPKGRNERAAAAQAWYTADQTIVEADIWINDSYAWNATGAPAADEVDLQSALLHEFGHWLILGHSPAVEAVMFARLTAGALRRELQPPDIAGISAIYPR